MSSGGLGDEKGQSRCPTLKRSLRSEPPSAPPPLPGAATHHRRGCQPSLLFSKPERQRLPACLPLQAACLLPLPTGGPRRGISSGALIPPSPQITQLSILYTPLACLLPPGRKSITAPTGRTELFLPATFVSRLSSVERRNDRRGAIFRV